MARRDSRRRNNRLTVTQTTERQRRVDQGTTDFSTPGYYRPNDTRTPDGIGTYMESGTFYSRVDGLGDNDIFARQKSPGSNTWVRYDGVEMQGDIRSLGDNAYNMGKQHNWIHHEADFSIKNPDKVVTDTISSSRMQALDKRSGDDDAQQRRDLKTKRDGRNKLRIQLSGDASAGRLRDGPNGDRKRNRLNIDVQGGGPSGLNVPR